MSLEDEIAELQRETNLKIEKSKIKLIAENEEEVALFQEKLNKDMAREEQLMNEQHDARNNEILRIKKQNLDDRLRLAKGEMSEEQIRQLRAQYQQEFENLDAAIRKEKQAQMDKMRAAQLQRKIDRERKRKADEIARQEKTRREAVMRMNAGMAKVFWQHIDKKAKEMQSEYMMTRSQNREQLKAKLNSWQRKVTNDRVERGGAENQIWELTQKQTLAKEAEARAEQQEVLRFFDADELFLRIRKVERTIERIKDVASPQEIKELMSDIQGINKQLQRSAQGSRK